MCAGVLSSLSRLYRVVMVGDLYYRAPSIALSIIQLTNNSIHRVRLLHNYQYLR